MASVPRLGNLADVLFVFLAAFADDSLLIDASLLRVLRMPGLDVAGGPALSGGLFLTFPGLALKLDGVDELRASIPVSEARIYAGMVASAEPLVATLVAVRVPFASTVGAVDAPRCHRAELERFTLTLTATSTLLVGQRVVAGSETITAGACVLEVTKSP